MARGLVEDAAERPDGGRERRRRIVLRSGIAITVIAAALAGIGFRIGETDTAPAKAATAWTTTKVTRQTLTISTTLNGSLSYGIATPLRVKATGTITWLPAQGTVIKQGQTLLRVNDQPIVLLYGQIPIYRTLGLDVGTTAAIPGPTGAVGASGAPGNGGAVGGAVLHDPAVASSRPAATSSPVAPLTGRDVEQLETDLRALGYTGFTVDSMFTAATATAVKRWQHDLGRPETGSVAVNDVVFAPGPLQVAQPLAKVGDDAGTDALSVTGIDRAVTVQGSTTDLAWATRGASVEIGLPDGRTTAGTVDHVGDSRTDANQGRGSAASSGAGTAAGAAAVGGSGATTTVPITIAITDRAALNQVRGTADVTVTYVARTRKDVLAVPVEALVALAGGGYGLEVVQGTTSHYVAVTPGMFTQALVEVSGASVSEGTVVRMPG